MAGAETHAEVGRMAALGAYQIAVKAEFLQSLSAGDVRYQAAADDLAWTQVVVTARNDYYSQLGEATMAYYTSVYSAQQSYGNTSRQLQNSLQTTQRQKANVSTTVQRQIGWDLADRNLQREKTLELSLLDTTFSQWENETNFKAGQASGLLADYQAGLAAIDGLDEAEALDVYTNLSTSLAGWQAAAQTDLRAYLGEQQALFNAAEAAAKAVAGATESADAAWYATAMSEARVAYEADFYGDYAAYLLADGAAYADYVSVVDAAQQELAEEQCRLLGLLQDAVNTGVNSVADGTTSLDVQVCFVAGTPILMGDESSKVIEKVDIDDIVLARPHDDPTGPLRKCRVVRKFVNEPQSTWKLTFDNGLAVQTTKEHPFFVADKGWVSAQNLHVGDTCTNACSKNVMLTSKEWTEEKQPVYNFEVEECHTYFVGSHLNNVLVHNQCTSCNGCNAGIKIVPKKIGSGSPSGIPHYYTKELCSCKSKNFNIVWIGRWTPEEQVKIIDALDLIRSNIDILVQEVADLKAKLSSSDYDSIEKHILAYQDVLEGIKSAVNGKDKIRIGQKSFWFSEAEGKYYHMVWRNISLNTSEGYDWKKQSATNLAQLLFHEISHQYGTVDDDSIGPMMNAHTIDDRIEKAIRGIKLDISNSHMLRMLITAPRK